MARKRAIAVVLVIVALGAWGVVALRGNDPTSGDDGLSPEQRQKGDRLSEIATRTGGDWSKLSEADRKYLVDEMSHGNEQSAKWLLLGAAGKIGGKPGDRATPGGPQSQTRP